MSRRKTTESEALGWVGKHIDKRLLCDSHIYFSSSLKLSG